MENLAGRPRHQAERVVSHELALARIAEVPCEPGVEVFSHVGGAVGHFRLHRAWYYWIASGLVPLDVAEALYADPGGRHDVRVGGSCTCPAPRECAKWVAPDGRPVLDRANETECRRYAGQSESSVMRQIAEQILACSVFADEPAASPGVEGYVEGFHIDTQLGLRLFADAARAAGLAGPELPERHARVELHRRWADRRLGRPGAPGAI